MTDFELIEKAKKGDQKAFKMLFNKYQRWVYNFIRTIVENQTDAEDLKMITFEKAFKKLPGYTPTCEFRSWLFTIAKHTCFDFLSKRRLEFIEINKNLHIITNEKGPEDLFITKQLTDQLEKALLSIRPYLRQKIELYYYKNRSYKEIARECNCEINEVSTQLYNAKRSLRTRLKCA